MSKLKVGIVGAAGYTGGELIRILLNHPSVEMTHVHSSSNGGNRISQVHRDLIGETDLTFSNEFSDEGLDVLFLCSGHGQSKSFLDENQVNSKVKIVDLSQDFRLQGYQSDRVFTYGLTEGFKRDVQEASNISNPGCFATCIQLGLLPLAKASLLNSEIHTSATTGSTGAGQKPTSTSHFSWRNNNLSIYKAFNHQHLKEINQSLGIWQTGFEEELNFLPFRGNFTRGILAAIYMDSGLRAEEALEIFQNYYEESPFVFAGNEEIDLKQVVNTNKCLLRIEKHGSKLLITSVIDNLVKGAAGQAVQNMNLMFELDEKEGLQLKASAF